MSALYVHTTDNPGLNLGRKWLSAGDNIQFIQDNNNITISANVPPSTYDYAVSNATELQNTLDGIYSRGESYKTIFLRPGIYNKGSAFQIPPIAGLRLISNKNAIIKRPSNDHSFLFANNYGYPDFYMDGLVFDYDNPMGGNWGGYYPQDDYAFLKGGNSNTWLGGNNQCAYILNCIFKQNYNGKAFHIGFGRVHIEKNYFLNIRRCFQFDRPNTARGIGQFLIIGNWFDFDSWIGSRYPRIFNLESGIFGQHNMFTLNLVFTYEVSIDYMFYFNQDETAWFRQCSIINNFFYIYYGQSQMQYLIYDNKLGNTPYRVSGVWANNIFANFDFTKFTNVTSTQPYDQQMDYSWRHLVIHSNYTVA